jgi:para-nitrobenzyl esterase
MKALGTPQGDVRTLQAMPADRLLAALQRVTNGSPIMGPGVVADGIVLPHAAFGNGAPAISANVPILVGHNRTETTVLFPPPNAFDLTWDTLPTTLKDTVREPEPLISGFRALMPGATPSQVYFAITTEAGMGLNARKVADGKATLSRAGVYAYLLAWPTPAFGGKLGTPHALDLPLVFNTVATSDAILGSGRADAQKLADIMSAAWIAFARTGSPNGPGLPEWPAYDLKNRATMVFDVPSAAGNDPLGRQQALIAQYA